MKNLKNGTVSNKSFDKEKLASLTKLAIGSRTIREFSTVSKLSEGFLSRLTMQRLESPPTRRSLAKITARQCEPQNGVTFEKLMQAAGYEEVDASLARQLQKGEGLPQDVLTATYPLGLTAMTLERTRQLGKTYEVKMYDDLFVIHSAGPDIVAIPAFCASGEAVNDEMQDAKWRVMQSMRVYGNDCRNAFFVILTNQKCFYDDFDKGGVYGPGGQFAIALTEDFKTFNAQRKIVIKPLNEEERIANEAEMFYDLTKYYP